MGRAQGMDFGSPRLPNYGVLRQASGSSGKFPVRAGIWHSSAGVQITLVLTPRNRWTLSWADLHLPEKNRTCIWTRTTRTSLTCQLGGMCSSFRAAQVEVHMKQRLRWPVDWQDRRCDIERPRLVIHLSAGQSGASEAAEFARLVADWQ